MFLSNSCMDPALPFFNLLSSLKSSSKSSSSWSSSSTFLLLLILGSFFLRRSTFLAFLSTFWDQATVRSEAGTAALFLAPGHSPLSLKTLIFSCLDDSFFLSVYLMALTSVFAWPTKPVTLRLFSSGIRGIFRRPMDMAISPRGRSLSL